ncbi:MAG: bifunctional pyr operon transcriptional regulator/uracil phosphoribosyltransferase PyrR [Candidatus Hydrogenedentes bacterium]|nr:bifunctional pyr operon transcriptional regulator/uracil phosphoribosyltransferase PyrR [Candidatus Hydrogenedentota bacterium]
MDGETMGATIRRLAQLIAEANPDIEALVILGILRRGRPLAERIAAQIEKMTGRRPAVGSLATTLYRDDFRAGLRRPKVHGETQFDFSLDDRTVLLVDDVLAAGRTIRAALDEVMDYGRPRRIQLACLVDRGGRELPIQADYLGWQVATAPNEWIAVHMKEIDGEDAVLLERRAPTPLRQEGAGG